MSESLARLVALSGPTAAQAHPLAAERITLGREAGNDITLVDEEISRRHAQIVVSGDAYLIEDLGSTNGTFVNGRRVDRPTPLQDGDVIFLGEAASFSFHRPEEELPMAERKTLLRPPDEPAAVREPFQVRYEAPITDPEMSTAAFRDPAMIPPPEPRRRPRRTLLGCGCLVLLAIAACATSLFLLDAFAPDTLYCGPFEGLFRLVGFDFACG